MTTFAQKYQPPYNARDEKFSSLNTASYINTAETQNVSETEKTKV